MLRCAVRIRLLEQVAVLVIFIAGDVILLVHESQWLGELAKRERNRVTEGVCLARHVAVGIVLIGRGCPVGRDDLDQVVVGVIGIPRDVPQGVDRLAEVALVVVQGGRLIAVGVGDGVLARCGIGIGLDLGLGARAIDPARGRQPALGVVGPLDAGAVGEGERGQGVGVGRGRAGRVGVGCHPKDIGEREQMLAARIVCVSRGLVSWLGDRADQAPCVVGDCDRRAIGSGQVGELATRVVAGRDAVAVGVLLVVERAVGVEGDGRAVGLDVLVGAAGERQGAVFAGGIGIAAVGILGEVKQRAVVVDRDVPLAVGAGGDLPVIGP